MDDASKHRSIARMIAVAAGLAVIAAIVIRTTFVNRSNRPLQNGTTPLVAAPRFPLPGMDEMRPLGPALPPPEAAASTQTSEASTAASPPAGPSESKVEKPADRPDPPTGGCLPVPAGAKVEVENFPSGTVLKLSADNKGTIKKIREFTDQIKSLEVRTGVKIDNQILRNGAVLHVVSDDPVKVTRIQDWSARVSKQQGPRQNEQSGKPVHEEPGKPDDGLFPGELPAK